MIKIENSVLLSPEQWMAIILGIRNAMNSWDKSDSEIKYENVRDSEGYLEMGPNDHAFMIKLRNAGTDHRKFMRMITVYVDITAPLYWWQEFDKHKVGVIPSFYSIKQNIAEKEFEFDDFSHEKLIKSVYMGTQEQHIRTSPIQSLAITIECLNSYRDLYLKTTGKKYLWQIIQLLPNSYNWKHTVMLSYEDLTNIYKSCRKYPLDEWRKLCTWIEELPYSELITGEEINRKD